MSTVNIRHHSSVKGRADRAPCGLSVKFLARFGLALVALLSSLASQSSFSDEIYTALFSDKAVGGYDTVAYFTEGKPVKGKKKFKVEHLEAEWFFSSAENKALFEANPDKYRPQYGGHCAWAVGANSAKAEGNPKYWRLVDDKLYLNYSKDVQSKWLKDVPGFIAKADKIWPEISE